MKKVLTAFLVSVLVLLLAFGGGYFAGWCFHQAGPVVIEKEKLVYRDRIRDYPGMSCLQLQEELIKYDRGIPALDIRTLNTGKGTARLRADAGLNGRTWSREATIRIPSSSKNWKYVVGFTMGVLCIAGGMWLYGRLR